VSHDRFVAAAVLTRPRGRARGKRVRFRDAVPVRRDRRDLRPPVWLAQARPDFTHRWFRLWFASASRAELVEVRAAVAPAAG
jgi:hypothetical protein